jgi:hypothetical protein
MAAGTRQIGRLGAAGVLIFTRRLIRGGDVTDKSKARDRAEAEFKKAAAVQNAVSQYRAEGLAVLEKTQRLRALRLAKEAEEAKEAESAVAESAVTEAAKPPARKRARKPR